MHEAEADGVDAAAPALRGSPVPVWTSAVHSNADFGLALGAFGLLTFGRLSPLRVVVFAAVAGTVIGQG